MRNVMTRRHVAQFLDTPEGRALAVVEWIEANVGGRGFTYNDVIDFLDPPIPSEAEARWRTLTAAMPRFTLDDRGRVLSTLRRRAEVWTTEVRSQIGHADIANFAPARRPSDSPFQGLPT